MWQKMHRTKKYEAIALYSGGPDSTVAPILARQQTRDILLLMIDLGELDNLQRAKERAETLGMDLRVIDGKRDFATKYLSRCIQANGSYWGYPLITPPYQELIW